MRRHLFNYNHLIIPGLFLTSFLILTSCNTSEIREAQDENETNTDIPVVPVPERELNVAFLVVDGVYNSELIAPMDVLHHTIFHTDPAMKVFTISAGNEIVRTFEGLRIISDYTIDQGGYPDIDVLVVPSAQHSMDSDLENRKLMDFIKETGKNARFVMSLCDGAFVLAKAGLVENHESTTFPDDIAKYREMFPGLTIHEGVTFVHDDNLITSSGGATSYDPALYLVELLYGRETARGIAKGLVIDWDLNRIDHLIVK